MLHFVMNICICEIISQLHNITAYICIFAKLRNQGMWTAQSCLMLSIIFIFILKPFWTTLSHVSRIFKSAFSTCIYSGFSVRLSRFHSSLTEKVLWDGSVCPSVCPSVCLSRLYCSTCKTICPKEIKETSRNASWQL